MGVPSPSPGWYPDPSGKPMQRYFDGAAWTEHYAPAAAAPAAVGVVTVGGTNHVVHAIISVMTCGLWLPVWLIIAAGEKKQTRPMDAYGNIIQPPRDPNLPPPTAMPAWVDGLPGNPWWWIWGFTAVLVVGGLGLMILGGMK